MSTTYNGVAEMQFHERNVRKMSNRSTQPDRRAAEIKHPRAIATLGLMALRGEGMARDEAAAKEYFTRAEALGFDVEDYLRQVGIARP